MEQHAGELAAIEALDNGKPITFASTVDVPMSAMWVRYMAGWPSKLGGSCTEPALQPPGTHHAYTVRQPVGVVGAIVPWNYPLVLAVWKLAPALAAGCTVVLKPAEATPYTALRLAQLVHDAGFPPGVLNVVLGDGRTGQALVDHPQVDKVSFTGSTILLTSDPQNPAYREEVFGPVITATPYDDIDELAALANDSDYGLAAHIYTRDLSAAHRLALAIDAGTVWVNTQLAPDPALPFGGFKQSGWGRENGAAVFEHYTESKSVIMKLA